MKLPERDYYPIVAAATLLGSDVHDLIHFAATGKIRLGVIFHIDEFRPEDYHCFDSKQEHEKDISEYIGFVYVSSAYFAHYEKSGELAFNVVNMLNDDILILTPPTIEVRSMDEIYIHRNDFLPLLGKKTETLEKPLAPRERNSLLNIIAALHQTLLEHPASKANEPLFRNQSRLIEHLESYRGYQGLSKSNLEIVFPEAKKSIGFQ